MALVLIRCDAAVVVEPVLDDRLYANPVANGVPVGANSFAKDLPNGRVVLIPMASRE
jgi:hypothetical protein